MFFCTWGFSKSMLKWLIQQICHLHCRACKITETVFCRGVFCKCWYISGTSCWTMPWLTLFMATLRACRTCLHQSWLRYRMRSMHTGVLLASCRRRRSLVLRQMLTWTVSWSVVTVHLLAVCISINVLHWSDRFAFFLNYFFLLQLLFLSCC